MAKKPLLTIDELRQLLDYDPETGIITYRARTAETFADPARVNGWNTRFAGKEAGRVSPTIGYKCFTTGSGVRWLAHRVAWALHYGHWPQVIDHVDGDRANNSISNLRNVTHQENHRNRKKAANNTSGVTGVTWDASRQRWYVVIGVGRRNKYLGRTKTLEEAVKLRRAAEMKYGFTARHGR